MLAASSCGRSPGGAHPPTEASLPPVAAHAADFEVGINFVMNKKVTELADSEQEALLDAMKAAGVRVVRLGFHADLARR